ncbi:MAG: RDD family protein [Pseudomonadota bacterium]
MIGAILDSIVALPLALALALVAGHIAGLALPPARHRGIDYWLDLSLAGDPALWGRVLLVTCIVGLYFLLFHAATGRTPGMHLLHMRVITVYGQRPSPLRSLVRTFGYLLSAATMSLGFVWIGFDREKRGLHDWLAGTYVIKDTDAGAANSRQAVGSPASQPEAKDGQQP